MRAGNEHLLSLSHVWCSVCCDVYKMFSGNAEQYFFVSLTVMYVHVYPHLRCGDKHSLDVYILMFCVNVYCHLSLLTTIDTEATLVNMCISGVIYMYMCEQVYHLERSCNLQCIEVQYV